MNLSKEVILGLGFEEVIENGFNMYKYCDNGIGAFYLEKVHKEKEFYAIYRKDESDELSHVSSCTNLESLFEELMKINHIDSMKLGKEVKQQEIRSVLGI